MRRTIRLTNEADILNFIREANKFEGFIDLSKGNHVVDGKSLLGIYTLGLYEDVVCSMISANEDDMIKFNNLVKPYEVYDGDK